MTQVTITGLERTLFTEPTAKGHVILAYFTAKVGPFTLKGCVLVRKNTGKLGVWLPNLTDPKQRNLRSITIDDEPTRSSLLQQALKMYRRMGGTDAEPNLPPYSEEEDAELLTPLERAEEALANILPPPVRRTIPVTIRKTEEPAE